MPCHKAGFPLLHSPSQRAPQVAGDQCGPITGGGTLPHLGPTYTVDSKQQPFPQQGCVSLRQACPGKGELVSLFLSSMAQAVPLQCPDAGFINQSERRFHLHLRDMELLPRSRGSLNWKKASPPTLSFTTESRTILPI